MCKTFTTFFILIKTRFLVFFNFFYQRFYLYFINFDRPCFIVASTTHSSQVWCNHSLWQTRFSLSTGSRLLLTKVQLRRWQSWNKQFTHCPPHLDSRGAGLRIQKLLWPNHVCSYPFIIARQHAMHAERDIVMATLSVCLSVCHTLWYCI